MGLAPCLFGVLGVLALPLALADSAVLPPGFAPLETLQQRPQRSAPATVIATRTSRFSAEISGRLLEIAVQVNETVAPNTRLFRLDCADYTTAQAALAADATLLDTRLAFARRQAERADRLVKDRNISIEEQDSRRQEVQVLVAQQGQLQVQQQQAALQVARCAGYAPFRAGVVALLAHVGEVVSPGTPILQLVDLDSRAVAAELLPTDAQTVIAGQRAQFQPQEEALSATPSGVARSDALVWQSQAPQLDPLRRTHELRFRFADPTNPPLIGTAGRLVWDGPPVLPPRWLVKRDGQWGLFTVDLAAEPPRLRFVPRPAAVDGLAVAVADLPPQLPVRVIDLATAEEGQSLPLLMPTAPEVTP